jgi:hypothetical protein
MRAGFTYRNTNSRCVYDIYVTKVSYRDSNIIKFKCYFVDKLTGNISGSLEKVAMSVSNIENYSLIDT